MNSRPLTCMPCFCEKEFFNTTRHFAHQRSMSSMAMFQQ
jgi:hypothetical protein